MKNTSLDFAVDQTLAVIGLGNIGSQFVNHAARMPRVARIICVDPDAYSMGNLACQEITNAEVGVAKAQAAARRLRGIRKDLKVTAIVDRVENVPWGQLRANVICGCVDSKGSRAAINQIARRMGMVYLDAGIRASGLLARVDVYPAGADSACLECAWGQTDYESLGRAYSCDGKMREAPSTGASSALGALAAALQAIECRKILDEGAPPATARQVIMEAACHHLYVNVLRPNPRCRFNHALKPIHPVRVTTLAQLLNEGTKIIGKAPAALAVESKSWVTLLACPGCGQQIATLRLQGRIAQRLGRCPRCGELRQPVGFGMLPRLDLASAAPHRLTQPLTRLGLRTGDVLTLCDDTCEQCIELVGPLEKQRG